MDTPDDAGDPDALYYDRQGQPIDPAEHARLKGDLAYRRVALDELRSVGVSTVWVGAYTHCDEQGRPLIFETCCFERAQAETGQGAPPPPWLSRQLAIGVEVVGRYATEADALAGHAMAVSTLRTVAGHAEAVATLRAAADASDPRVFRALSELADALTAQGRRLYAVAVETSGPVPDIHTPGEVRVVHVRSDGRPWAEVIAAETLARQQEAKP